MARNAPAAVTKWDAALHCFSAEYCCSVSEVPSKFEAFAGKRALPLAPVLGTVLLALIVRLLHLYDLSHTPLFAGLVVDAQAYAKDAAAVLSHGTMEVPFYRPPLYAYIRALLTLVGLGSPWGLGIAHAVAGSATAGLLYVVTWRLIPESSSGLRHWSASTAGAITALYGPLIVYDAQMLPPAWVNLLVAVAYLAATSQRAQLGREDVVCGGSLGLATTGWAPVALLAVPMLLLRRQSLVSSERSRAVLALVAAMSFGPGLTAVHNATHGAPGVLVSANVGINLWLGNNPHWRKTVTARPGIYYDLEYRRPTQAGATTLVDREAHYVELVRAFIKKKPLAAVGRTIDKFYMFLHGREIRRDHDFAWLRRYSTVAALSIWEWGIMFPFGLLLPLALACPSHAIRPRAKGVIVLSVGLYAFVLAWFIVGARYRLSIVLLLIPLAATCVAWGIRRVAPGSAPVRAPNAAAGGAVLLCTLVLCNASHAYSNAFAATTAELLLVEGQAHAALNDTDQALRVSKEATERAPHDPDAHLQLGQLLLTVGRAAEAADHFRRAGVLVPESEAPWILHGHAMMAMGRYNDAIYNFREALKRNAFQAAALRDLGKSYALAGERSSAIDNLRRYLNAGHRDDEASYMLAQLLLDEGKTADALPILLDLQSRHPDSVEIKQLVSRTREE